MQNLFVYGTLKRGFRAHHLLEEQDAVFLKNTKTSSKYKLYKINWFPGMVIDESEQGGVKGELFSVNNKCMRSLDQYEGAPDLFVRHNVELEDGTHAIAYLFNQEFFGEQRIEDGEWNYGKEES